MVGERREELVEEVPVRRVDLDEAETGAERADRGGLEGVNDAVDPGPVEGDGDGIALVERDRAGADDRPAPLRGS